MKNIWVVSHGKACRDSDARWSALAGEHRASLMALRWTLKKKSCFETLQCLPPSNADFLRQCRQERPLRTGEQHMAVSWHQAGPHIGKARP